MVPPAARGSLEVSSGCIATFSTGPPQTKHSSRSPCRPCSGQRAMNTTSGTIASGVVVATHAAGRPLRSLVDAQHPLLRRVAQRDAEALHEQPDRERVDQPDVLDACD